MTLRKRLSLLIYNLDSTFAIIGIVISIFFVIFLLSYKNHLGYLPINLILFSLLIISSCLLWLVIKKKNPLKFYLPGSTFNVKLWAACFFSMYIISIFVVYTYPVLYERPITYFILTIFMVGAIACEIYSAEKRHVIFILIQVLLLGISLAASLQLIVPSLIGGDPWYHCGLTTKILNEHYIPDGYGYSTMPFFHLTIAISSIFTNLPYKIATMASVSFIQTFICSIFIFLIANYLFRNHRIGLLAALLLIIGDQNIIRSIAPIPNSYGYSFILMVIYAIFIIYNGTNILRNNLLIAIFMFPIILIHSIPAVMMSFCLLTIYMCFYYSRLFSFNKTQSINFIIPLTFILVMLSWWYYVSTQAEDATRIIAEAFNLKTGAYSPVPDITANYAMADSLNNISFISLGLYIFVSISIIGLLYMISKKGNYLTFCFAFVSIIPFGIYIFVYLLGGFVYSDNFNALPYRWINLTQIFLSLPLAVSIYIFGNYKMKDIKLPPIVYILPIIILSILMIMTPSGSPDNHILTPSKQYWSYYSDSEISGNDFFGTKSTGILTSDRDHAIVTSSVFQHTYGFNLNRLKMLDYEIQSGTFESDNSIKIFRERRILEFQRVGVFSPKIQPDLNTYMSNCGFSKIYESPTMRGYN